MRSAVRTCFCALALAVCLLPASLLPWVAVTSASASPVREGSRQDRTLPTRRAALGSAHITRSAAAYANPLRSVRALVPGRVDMGVDYAGIGPIYAIGPAVITNLYNCRWPGGTFISYRFTSGRYRGLDVYVAEDIRPAAVGKGLHVTSRTVVGYLYGGPAGTEWGWAQPPGNGSTMAAQAHQSCFTGDPGCHATAYGASMSNLLHRLGAPAGIIASPIHGTVQPPYPSA